VGCDNQGAVASATTKTFLLVADLGPLSEMFSSGQVPSSVPANSEIMLSGSMTTIDTAVARHLEVHICDRKSGEVVAGANPSITLQDTTAGTTAVVSVATMEGVGAGQADLHYGNNVAAPVGHSFVATVTVRGETAMLRFIRSPDPTNQSVPPGTDFMSH
jgi:hypothetical protein